MYYDMYRPNKGAAAQFIIVGISFSDVDAQTSPLGQGEGPFETEVSAVTVS